MNVVKQHVSHSLPVGEGGGKHTVGRRCVTVPAWITLADTHVWGLMGTVTCSLRSSAP
jgi:hypothetical protein